MTSTNVNIQNLDHLFDQFINRTASTSRHHHSVWKINRMEPARILRNKVSNPKSLPANAAIGVERFVAIDTARGPSYRMPSADCSNMFVRQVMGSRMVHLEPTPECKHRCKRTSVRLEQDSIRKCIPPDNRPRDQHSRRSIAFSLGNFSVLRLVALEAHLSRRQNCQVNSDRVHWIVLLVFRRGQKSRRCISEAVTNKQSTFTTIFPSSSSCNESERYF